MSYTTLGSLLQLDSISELHDRIKAILGQRDTFIRDRFTKQDPGAQPVPVLGKFMTELAN